ncbi:PstC family ABC transporter permease [Desulfobacula toluolica]|uniref:PstC: phosphate-specific transport system, cytoplasmic membrane component n=1 Tax=Desulfobacula toluolica (strain DSM 7467 / Tol2) TaxID=651182 RepID=K0N503_DESTT|nr:ABC transporter permease subunit [Desulfobacula toluolica]CCK79204.1 PstC: phosphate-specific transport system, cytoplasmic membrane component [Desulfobacula toluolica Tol2]
MRCKDTIAGFVFSGASVFSAAVTLAVLGFMIVLSLPVLKNAVFFDVLTAPWSPDHGQFGILPMIVGTLYISLLSLLISFPLSLGCSIFIELVRPDGPGRLLKKIVQLMTAIPTVVYGFVGVFLLVPIIREWFVYGSGMCILSASLMLALLIAPTMILLFSQSFARVPQSYLNAVDALGGNMVQKLWYVILPNAWRGILTGIILAFGRAMGDTLIALMISGNCVALPSSVLDSARTLTAHIALIIAADFDSIEFKILFICGITLYLMTSCGIILARSLDRKPG